MKMELEWDNTTRHIHRCRDIPGLRIVEVGALNPDWMIRYRDPNGYGPLVEAACTSLNAAKEFCKVTFSVVFDRGYGAAKFERLACSHMRVSHTKANTYVCHDCGAIADELTGPYDKVS